MDRHRRWRWFVLLLAVLVGHGLGLHWLQTQLPAQSRLLAMADPVLTRIIKPLPAAVAAQPPAALVVRAALPLGRAASAPQVTPAPEAVSVSGEQVPDEAAQPTEPAASPEPAQELVPDRPGSSADSWPADTRVSYRMGGYYRGDLYGSARVQWQRQASRYQVRVDLSMAVILRLSMISQGEASGTTLLPEVYEEQFPWGVRRLRFDGTAIRFDNGAELPQPPGVQDTASQFVELSHRFVTGQDALQVGAQVSLWLARPQGVSRWTYDVVAQDVLQLPEIGPVAAFHLRPRPVANPAGVITAELWFAPSLQYLPVRIRISLGDGNFVDLLAERIEQAQASAPQTGLSP